MNWETDIDFGWFIAACFGAVLFEKLYCIRLSKNDISSLKANC